MELGQKQLSKQAKAKQQCSTKEENNVSRRTKHSTVPCATQKSKNLKAEKCPLGLFKTSVL